MPTTPPSPLNYYIGKGNVFTAAVDSSSFTHIGNCPKFSLKPAQEFIEHFSSMAPGASVLDLSLLKTQSLEVTINCDEMHGETLALGLGATLVSGVYRIAGTTVFRAVKFVGANAQGPLVQIFCPKVQFTVNTEIDFIGDTFAQFPLVGKALFYPNTSGGSTFTFADVTFI